ncbi:Scr1 family TA system antitoxin-like transcriptional regulator [Actinokineospora spheciospongiae]|uniref:Scr1 family TA system antitoxin-like transcriptional regulator n=1 Tax=Actinokineospora spheciospongiae TaxID=909613 RepID=UPI000D713D58|nr:Scr1 family TA system antitoxin-like transcriptional regulator [Actinokineospora spheciospongiae]PWW53127.1 helix-turn-helix protein [Actinokineospora spheciospongiae]
MNDFIRNFLTTTLTEYLKDEGHLGGGRVLDDAVVLFRTISIHPASHPYLDKRVVPFCDNHPDDSDCGMFDRVVTSMRSASGPLPTMVHRGHATLPHHLDQATRIEILEQAHTDALAERSRPRPRPAPRRRRAPATPQPRTRQATTLRALLLGHDLNTRRRDTGITIRALAEHLGITRYRCGQILHGRRIPSPEELDLLCTALSAPDQQRIDLRARAADAHHTDWLTHHAPWNPDRWTPLRALEPHTAAITTYDTTHIPHALRTDRYHRALLHTLPAIPTIRHPHLITDLPHHRNTRAVTTHYLHANTLTHPTLPREVLHEQLTCLRDTTDTTIRLLPHTTPTPTAHPFRLLTIPGAHPVVFLDHDSTTLLLEHPDTTTPYLTLTNTLDTTALSPRDTHHHLADLTADLR